MTFDRISWPRRTERLTIRPAETADLPAVFAVRSRKDVAEWMPEQPTSYDDWLLRLGRTGAVDRMLVIELDGVVIGDLYVHVEDAWAQVEVADQAHDMQAELGWVLDPAFTGHGYATEGARALLRVCFEDLGVHRVVAGCFVDNDASWRLMERIGMRRESHTLRDGLHRSGHWLDGYTYAVLADEWASLT